MKERFGQFQFARHYQAVERSAKDGFRTMDRSPQANPGPAEVAGRFYDWFDRQLARLEPGGRDPAKETPTVER